MSEIQVKVVRQPVTVFILNWNRRDDLRRALQSLRHQTYPPAEVLVADSGSTDGAAEMVEAEFPDVKLVRLGGNFGCPGGRNLGMKHATHELVFCVDNDGQLHSEAIARAVQTMSHDDRVAVVAGTTQLYTDLEEVDLCSKVSGDRAFYSGKFCAGVCLLRKSVFEALSGYPTHTMYGGEEMHLSLRLWDRQYRVVEDPAVVLWHARSPECRDEVLELVNRRLASVLVRTELFPLSTALANLGYALAVAPVEAMKRFSARQWLRWLGVWSTKLPAVFNKLARRTPVARSTVSWYFRSRTLRVPVGEFQEVERPRKATV